jgi:hypothetical protein
VYTQSFEFWWAPEFQFKGLLLPWKLEWLTQANT